MMTTHRISGHMREVLHGAGIALVLKVLGTGLAFGFTVLLARLLGARSVGIYYLALTIISIASMVGRVGLDNALLRFTAAHAGQKEWSKVVGVYRKSISIAGVASALMALLVLAGAPWMARVIFTEPELALPLRLMALAILPMSLFFLHAELLRGLKRIWEAVFIQSVGTPLFALPLLAVLGGTLGVMGATFAQVTATLLVFVLGVMFCRKALPQLHKLRGSFETRLLVRTSIPLFLVASMALIMNWADILMLGIMTDSESVGIYGVTVRTAKLATFILIAVNTVSAPKYASLYKKGERQALQDIAQGTARLVTVATLPLLALFMFAPGFVLGLLGPSFKAGATTLVVLACGQLANIMAGSVVYLLLMSGKQTIVGRAVAAATVLNILLNYVLIGALGILGAGIATAVTMIITNLVLAWQVYRELGIVSLIWPTAKLVLERSQS